MGQGNNLTEFKEVLTERMRRQIPTQVFWGVVKSVDWNKKTCTVTGMKDDLDFYNVSLGLQDQVIKPTVGAKCLIGSIENKDTGLYLIDVEAYDTKHYKIGDLEFEIDQDGFTIKKGDADLKEILTSAFDDLKNATITTPAGPGFFSPGDKAKFEQLKNDVSALFK